MKRKVQSPYLENQLVRITGRESDEVSFKDRKKTSSSDVKESAFIKIFPFLRLQNDLTLHAFVALLFLFTRWLERQTDTKLH